ncbi:MAG: peroxiredoxin-like family protein [Pseudomonadota bacterium]
MKHLNHLLANFQTQFESGSEPYNISSKQVAIMHEFDHELRSSGILENVLRPGDSFPDFVLLNHERRPIKSIDLLMRGPVVVNFFRGVWCPYCNFELQCLQKSLADIEGMGATLIAISPQLPHLNKMTVMQNRLMYDILFDDENKLSEELGIAYQLSDALIENVFKPLEVDLSHFNNNNSWRLPLSARFVIDIDGTIVSSNADVNYRRRPEPSETVAIIKAITRRSVIKK